MEIITLDKDNIETEHICCAMASKASNEGVNAKKEWLSARFDEGLRFKKLNARGKVFIEYLPAENAWLPIEANGYMLINCLWVSGRFKGHGYGQKLLEECEKEAAGMKGIVVMVGNKKKPFLSDKAFFVKNGYEVCDQAPPFFELLVKKVDQSAETPCFADSAKQGMPEDIRGIDIFYTHQCPFTATYTHLLKPVILNSSLPIRLHHIDSKETAKTHFCPITTYSVFINGKFQTNEILTPAKLEKMIEKL